MQLESLHDRDAIRRLLEGDRGRFAYLLGDLDPFFWGRTVWFAAADGPTHRAIILLYLAHQRPVALIFGQDEEALRWLLAAVTPLLPPTLEVHLEQSMRPAMTDLGWSLRRELPHHRMLLGELSQTRGGPTALWFMPQELEELQRFYALAYPENYFDPRMLATGRYVGCRDEEGAISAVAGVHVFSPGDAVAALGNITVHPRHRGRGLGGVVTGALCARLRAEGIETIALNVFHENTAAIRLYQRLGFAIQLTFIEAIASRP